MCYYVTELKMLCPFQQNFHEMSKKVKMRKVARIFYSFFIYEKLIIVGIPENKLIPLLILIQRGHPYIEQDIDAENGAQH